MFFSEELVTGKPGSLGVIWLMATLGPRNKRITRKAITGVEIQSSCQLIGEPPEPLALRLSGHLLVGVTRVFKQNFDLFYAELQEFNTSLRRSIVSDLGVTSTGLIYSAGGIDLVNGGTSRFEQITLPLLETTIDVYDLEFGQIDWSVPPNTKTRRGTSKLNSTSGQSISDPDGDPSDDEGAVGRRRRTQTGTPMFAPPMAKPSSNGFSADFEALQFDDPLQDDFIPQDLGLLDESDQFVEEPSKRKRSLSPPPVLDAEDNENFQSTAPKPTKKKRKSTSKVAFDQSLEIEDDAESYMDNMARQRRERQSKRKVQAAQTTAETFVNGAGLWLDFFDDNMSGFFETVFVPPKFQWQFEKEHKNPGIASIEEEQIADQILDAHELELQPQHSEMGVSENEELRSMGVGRNETNQQLPWDVSTSVENLYQLAIEQSSMTNGSHRFSSATPLLPRRRRLSSRSASLLSNAPASEMEVFCEEAMEGVSYKCAEAAPEQNTLSALAPESARFLNYIEAKVKSLKQDTIELEDLAPTSTHKRVAALAFYNCLSLASKYLIKVKQPGPNQTIRIRLL